MNPRELLSTTQFVISKIEFADTGSSAWFYILRSEENGVELVLKVPRKFRFQTEKEYSAKVQVEMLALKLLKNVSVEEGDKLRVRTIQALSTVTFNAAHKHEASFIQGVQAEIETDIPEEVGIALEYLKEYTSLDRFQFSNSQEKITILKAIEKYVLEMIKKGVATRDLKGSNFQIKRNGTQFEVVFIDPGLCQLRYQDKTGKEISVGTSTENDIGSYITAFPPNIAGCTIRNAFTHECISMEWCLTVLQFWIYFGVYPFYLDSDQTLLDLDKFTDLDLSLPGYIEDISATRHQFVPLDNLLENPGEIDIEFYNKLVKKMEQLLNNSLN